MWTCGWRDEIWSQLNQEWDIVIIGGGITGAGILREAAHAGLRVLLVEAGDFASGTSSRSGKMVHGGLRYLKNAQIRLTMESVHERERLMREGRGLVNSYSFLLANFVGDKTPAWVFGAGLMVYDILALKWGHKHYNARGVRERVPQITAPDLLGGFRYIDAITDDARLTLRVIREAVRDGGVALNYARAVELLRGRDGQVCGVAVEDMTAEGRRRKAEARARVVINATGAWADQLRAHLTPSPSPGGRRGEQAARRLRKLRGSHLVFPWKRLPLTRAVMFLHPRDHRPLYALPWDGVTIVGTTDLDCGENVETDPAITASEAEYLMVGAQRVFPDLGLTLADAHASFSGLRPVIDTGQADPSKESREFVLWDENGLLTVAGGKLTTFRLMAHNALRSVRARLPHPRFNPRVRVLDKLPSESSLCGDLSHTQRLRLLGRYGVDACDVVNAAESGELTHVDEAMALWAELRYAARAEGVLHLDDLLLRRVRIGLLLPRGGMEQIARVRTIAQKELGWDDARWECEAAEYARLWEKCYSISNFGCRISE